MSDAILEKIREDLKNLSPEDHSSKAMSIRLCSDILPHVFKFFDDELAASTLLSIPHENRLNRMRDAVESMLGIITNTFANTVLTVQCAFSIEYGAAHTFCMVTLLEYMAIHAEQRKKLGIGVDDPNTHTSMDMYIGGKKEPFDIVKILEAMKKGHK